MLLQSFSKKFLKASSLASFVAPIALGGAVMGFAANSAQAATDFAGIYAPANWTQLIVSNGSIDTTNAPASVTLIGADNNAPNAGQSDFTIAAPSAGQVTFNWNYTTVDSSGTAEFDPFGYILNGIFTKLTNDTIGNQSGTGSFSVVFGDTFGFSQRTGDSDFGGSQTIIGNFNGPVGGPSPVSVPAPLPLFGVGASLVWSRRLRKRVATAS